MLQKFCKWLLFDHLGWKEEYTIERRDKCIIAVAPHTSNWDFLLGECYYAALGRRARFLMKREWFFWPFGCLLKRLGGIPVNRKRRTSLTDHLAELAQSEPHFELAITPEGTRRRKEEWKLGFYFIALKAKLPIQLIGIDYAGKRIVATKEVWPTGNVESDIKEIKQYFSQFEGKAKHPENFAVNA